MLPREELVKTLPPVLCLIGLQAGGKTSDAKLIAKEVDGLFFDGDDAIPKDSWMKWQIDKGLPVIPSQVQHYIEHHLIPTLIAKRKEAAEQNKPLIVSQALFFNKHRQLIQRELGGNISFLVIETLPELQVSQIEMRCAAQGKSAFHAWREKKAVLMSNPYFEKPDSSIKASTIRHLGKGYDQEFIAQFKKLSCYAELAREQCEQKSIPTSSAASILSELPKSKPTSDSIGKESKTIPTTPSYNRFYVAGGIVTLAAVGVALFARETNASSELDLTELQEVMSTISNKH